MSNFTYLCDIEFYGYRREYPLANKKLQNEKCSLELVTINLPKFERPSLYSMMFRSYHIPVCKISIFDNLQYALPIAAYSRIKLQSLLESDKSYSFIVKIDNFKDLPIEFYSLNIISVENPYNLEFSKFEQKNITKTYAEIPKSLEENNLDTDFLFCKIKNIEKIPELDIPDYNDIIQSAELETFHQIKLEKFKILDNTYRQVLDLSLPATEMIIEIKELNLKRNNPSLPSQKDKKTLQTLANKPIQNKNLISNEKKNSQILVNKLYQDKSQALISSIDNKASQILSVKLNQNKNPSQKSSIDKKAPKILTATPNLIQNQNFKAILIEKIEDLAKLKFSHNKTSEKMKKTVSFAPSPIPQTYDMQDHLSQASSLPLKIFINHSSLYSKKIANSLQIPNYYVVGLEISENYMDEMDLILTWQTAVKFCEGSVLVSSENIMFFLRNLHTKILKFDLVLLVFICPTNINPSVEAVLDGYISFLKTFSINFRYFVVNDPYEAIEPIQDYLARYTNDVEDKEIWKYVQGRISEAGCKGESEFLNVYSMNILEIGKEIRKEEFNKLCTCLGTNMNRFEKLFALLQDFKVVL
ncbi:hypothetical protein SteCoe_23764 [Stentor coeruleus]|uniref:Uncharacterized protein n=1 Tax=Stentor coeruleus TaxID=5963 RepID=A0A1R2BJ40_9CILI|nr:hypothetical protein SteCoe_23764 [Stentor coeruleus]